MRCIKIEFHGYKRLAATSCNTDGRMIAFLGPNEAGKSSVLQGLEWLSHGEGPLPGKLMNRSMEADPDKAVVCARFALSNEDREQLADLPVVGNPHAFSLARYPDGTIRTGLRPELRRDPTPFEEALEALGLAVTNHEMEFHDDATGGDPDNPEPPTISPWLDTVKASLSDTESEWDSDNDSDFDQFCQWLREPTPDEEMRGDDGELQPRASNVAEMLEAAREILRTQHPEVTARERLREAAPEFALFDDDDRKLASTYDLEDPDIRNDPPKALANLLWIAELDLDELMVAIEDENTGRARTMERRANERLAKQLGPKWRQENIDVALRVNGLLLEVLVIETSDDGADTPISERSDGLRMFVALVAFLARRDFETPPILLVDEAETHLHYDAQADLVEVLTTDVEATQVFYTTHSPGCLPRDLGTGIRLVAPTKGRRDASELRNDFWTNERPGFTPLLFAMGAGAAAFSAFRRAVLAEGAADMILLPSLVRLATGEKEVPYQVAPGLANHHGSGLELEETAARVVYLLDGDQGGDDHEERLTGMGIDRGRIFRFDTNKAPEDYVKRVRYLEVVNALIASTGRTEIIKPEDLGNDTTVSKAVADWCKTKGFKAPGKTIVASALVNNPDKLALETGAAVALRTIHKRLLTALAVEPHPRANP